LYVNIIKKYIYKHVEKQRKIVSKNKIKSFKPSSCRNGIKVNINNNCNKYIHLTFKSYHTINTKLKQQKLILDAKTDFAREATKRTACHHKSMVLLLFLSSLLANEKLLAIGATLA
jgi:hypothetical protein